MIGPRSTGSRRRFLSALGILGLGGLGAGYTRYFEPKWLDIGTCTIPLSGRDLEHPIRILHLSDLHASNVVSLEFIAEAVRLGVNLKPDLIFLTGDFVTRRFHQFEAYAAILASLSDSAPCYAVLGNHDGGAWARSHGGYENTEHVRGLLTDSGITLLHNASAPLRVRGVNLHLVGLGDYWAKEFDPAAAFPAEPPAPASPVLVLSHNPDTKEQLKDRDWEVLFCGHTHGGQLQLPLIGTPFAPVRDKRFVKGLHRWEGRWIQITKGIGNLLGVRFNCRPEISLVTLA